MIEYLNRHIWLRALALAALWMIAFFVVILVHAVLSANAAEARECLRHAWVHHYRPCDVSEGFFGSCPRQRRLVCVRWAHYYDNDYGPDRPERVYGYYRERDDAPRCRSLAVATGHEAYGRAVAREEGEQAWMEEVRGKWGARYMDVRNAINLTYECYRSATGNRATEKTADVLGKVLEQCRVEGIACRAPKEHLDEARAEDGTIIKRDVSRNVKEDDEPRGSRVFRRWQDWRRRHHR